jgi:hypothetical protein
MPPRVIVNIDSIGAPEGGAVYAAIGLAIGGIAGALKWMIW